MCDILQGCLDKGRQNGKALLDGGSMPLAQIMDALNLSDSDREAVTTHFAG